MSGSDGRAASGEPAHVFGESPDAQVDPNPPHDSTLIWHTLKAQIMAEEAQARALLRRRHQVELDALNASFTEKYREAARTAGFR